MTKEDNIIVPRWFLEVVEDTLRIQNNINLDKETGETCQDRNIRQSLNGVRKLLKGEELTGMERLEKLQPSLPSNLDDAANKFAVSYDQGTCDGIAQECFKSGAEWMAGQGETIFDTIDVDDKGQRWISDNLLQGDYDCGEEVILQIRKK